MKRFCVRKLCSIQSFSINILFILFLAFGLSGCGDTKGAAQKSETEEFTFGKSLYVTNAGDGSLLVFDPPAINTKTKATRRKPVPRVSEGNISPSRRFPDAFNGPAGVFLDKANDTLYIANAGQNSISIYEKISTLTPSAAATRVISGSQTLLNQPFGLAYDATRSRLYVANRDGNTVAAFDASCTGGGALQGNIAPCSLLRLAGDDKAAQLDLPRAVAIDPVKDILYISNMGSDSILVYDQASTSLGGVPSACKTDFAPCNKPPNRIISPHAGAEDASKLELPFGIFIDSVNDRLYVANTGLNTPGILIYENASTRDGGAVPERAITSQIAQLPSTCSTFAPPPECNLTQLTIPSGIDVDIAGGRIFVINNNSPNNVNQSSSGNVDSPSLVVFNNINTQCPLSGGPVCSINPDRRVGGDVSAEVGTTLSAPLGIAIDPVREITYIANTGGNNLLSYSLAGNIAPIKRNASVDTTQDLTKLEEPVSFFYDESIDRLYVANHIRSFVNDNAIVVYDQVSDIGFSDAPSNIPPTWAIQKDTRFNLLRGFHVDQQRGYLLALSGSSGPRLSIYCIRRTDGTFNTPCATSPLFNILWNEFPGNGQTAPLISAPNAFMTFDPGFGVSGPVSMAVDAARGDVHIADKVNKTIYVFNLNSLTNSRTITSTNFNLPHGVAIDTTKDILYVTDVGNNEILAFNGASGLTGNSAATRVITTTLPAADALDNPVAPFIDTTADRLYLINVDTDAIFTYDQASTITGETAPSGIIAGLNTLLDFEPPVNPPALTGALIVAKQNGNQTLFVGQPVSSDCEAGAGPCQPGALLIYGIQGRVAPSKVFLGGGGSFASPSGVAVDGIKNLLYVANQESNALSILQSADAVDVNNPATVKADLINIQLNRPAGLAVDTVQNTLFVSNSASTNCTAGPCNAVLVFKSPDTLANGAVPGQTLTHAQLNDPRGVAVDSGKARLYVASRGSNAVLIYAIDGGTAVFGTVLSGAGSKLNQPVGVAVDTVNDILYILNEADKEVLVFEGASTLSGNEAPARIITGSNGSGLNVFSSPSAIAADSANDVLYIADEAAQAVYIVLDASTREDQAVDKTLAGDKTGLFKPTALAVDTTAGSF